MKGEHHTCSWTSWCAMCEYEKAQAKIEKAVKLCEDRMMYAQAADIMKPDDHAIYDTARRIRNVLHQNDP